MERIKYAVALPVRISIKDVYDDTCTELLITAQLDSGERAVCLFFVRSVFLSGEQTMLVHDAVSLTVLQGCPT